MQEGYWLPWLLLVIRSRIIGILNCKVQEVQTRNIIKCNVYAYSFPQTLIVKPSLNCYTSLIKLQLQLSQDLAPIHLNRNKKALIPILQSDLHEWDPQEHAGVAPQLRPEGPQGVGLDLLDELDLVHEEGDPDIQADVVNSFPLPIHGYISGFRFFLFLKASMWLFLFILCRKRAP